MIMNICGNSSTPTAKRGSASAAAIDAWLQRTSDPFETGDQVSDRYQPGHRDGVLPQVADEEFRIALQARRASIK